MIRVDTSGVVATPRLVGDQQALAQATDATGPATVKARGSAGWKSLRPQLREAQRRKCAYCEDRVRDRMSEVDHVRPQSAAKYWWLAFSMPNLVLACRRCNGIKSDKFDLVWDTAMLAPRQEPWTCREAACLVDPTTDVPDDHITFVLAGGRWRIAAANNSSRGAWTIAALELDGDDLNDEMDEYVSDVLDPLVLQYQIAVAASDRAAIARATDRLVRLALPEKRWTQLVRVVVEHVRAGTYRLEPS